MKVLLSVILGLILAWYLSTNWLTEYHGPDSNEIKKNIYSQGNKCYRYEATPYICPL